MSYRACCGPRNQEVQDVPVKLAREFEAVKAANHAHLLPAFV
jgi:hypothetical protein